MISDAPPARAPSEGSEPGGRILVADDDRATREDIASVLRADGHVVELCEDGAEALARVAQGGLDVVLLDVVMPKLSGTEACRLIKSKTVDTFLPVMLITSRSDVASRIEGLRLGADDYIIKPFHRDELSARVAAMLRIRRLICHLTEDRDRLLRTAVQDELTGLPNRRYFELRLAEERKRSERHQQPFACVLLDVSGVVTPPDAAGSSSEPLLSRTATAVKHSVREGDVVARFGGTIFAALLSHTHFVGALAAAERVLRDISATLESPEAMAGVSIGAVVYPSRDTRTAETMLAAAETALDEARLAGGGCICIVQQRKYLYTPTAAALSPGGRPDKPAVSRTERPPPPRTERPAATEGRAPVSVRGDRAPLSVRAERNPPTTRAERPPASRTERPPASRTERPASSNTGASNTGRRSWVDPPATVREPAPPEPGERKG